MAIEKERLVIDTSVIIDLHKARILGQIFRLDYKWIITNLVEEELKSVEAHSLKKLGLEAVILNKDQTRDIYRLVAVHKGLSKEDLSCFVYARDNHLPIVTRDNRLRDMARANGIETHDTPWVLMELVRKGILQPDDAADALELINNKLNKPREDWKHQIRRWRKGL